MEKWGEYIKIKRFKAKLTQEELAQKIGISRPSLSRLENDNENRPTVKVISGLSKAFGLAEKEVVQEVYGIGSSLKLRGY